MAGSTIRPGRAAPVLATLFMAVLLGWAMGWAWIAVPAVIAALGIAANTFGHDSRSPGDWRRTGGP